MSGRNDLPEWVIDYVCAVMRGYEYRAEYLKKHNSHGNRVARLYWGQNNAIDAAFDAECSPAERNSIKSAICLSLPYERIPDCPCGRRRFYDIKWEVIRAVAKNLNIFKP